MVKVKRSSWSQAVVALTFNGIAVLKACGEVEEGGPLGLTTLTSQGNVLRPCLKKQTEQNSVLSHTKDKAGGFLEAKLI